jgi:hypothetical protein
MSPLSTAASTTGSAFTSFLISRACRVTFVALVLSNTAFKTGSAFKSRLSSSASPAIGEAVHFSTLPAFCFFDGSLSACALSILANRPLPFPPGNSRTASLTSSSLSASSKGASGPSHLCDCSSRSLRRKRAAGAKPALVATRRSLAVALSRIIAGSASTAPVKRPL